MTPSLTKTTLNPQCPLSALDQTKPSQQMNSADSRSSYPIVQVSIANAVDRQKRNTDKNGRSNMLLLIVSRLVLLSTVNLPRHVVTNVGSSELLPKYTGSCRVVHRQGNAYTIKQSRRTRTPPTFHVGRLLPYRRYVVYSERENSPPKCSRIPKRFFWSRTRI